MNFKDIIFIFLSFLIFNFILPIFSSYTDLVSEQKYKLGNLLIKEVKLSKASCLSKQEYLDKAQKLIDLGADINIQDKSGRTALMYASAYAFKDMIKLLIDSRANIDIQDKFGLTALMIASKKGNSKIVKLLISANAQVDIKDFSGKSALIHACTGSVYKDSKLIILNEHKNIIKKYYLDTVKYLLGAVINISHKDNSGQTAFDLASSNSENKKILELLEKKLKKRKRHKLNYVFSD